MKLITVNDEQLVSIKAQPAARTAPAALKNLRLAYAKTGLIVPPIVRKGPKPGLYEVLDGNRRRATKAMNGGGALTVLLIEDSDTHRPMTAAEMFAALSEVRTQRGSDWAQGWAQEGDSYLKSMPSVPRKNIKELVRVLGRKRAVELCAAGNFGPSIVRQICQLHAFLSGYRQHTRHVQVVGNWVINHKMASVVYSTLRAVSAGQIKPHRLAARFARAIDDNAPIKKIA